MFMGVYISTRVPCVRVPLFCGVLRITGACCVSIHAAWTSVAVLFSKGNAKASKTWNGKVQVPRFLCVSMV